MEDLCVTGRMSIREWISLAADLDVDGLEFYAGFKELKDPNAWPGIRRMVEEFGLQIPMLCCSPDFCHTDADYRADQIDKQKQWINMAAALGAKYCRVLSGQARPEITVDQGLQLVVEAIEACLAYAERCGIVLILENHYKDDFWTYPEFAQGLDVFLALLARIRNPRLRVNYDPSNALLAGDDPMTWLRAVLPRVVTMHASDRYLAEGTLEDLRKEEVGLGYARRLAHGEIGKGLIDYDAIFSELAAVEFRGWISIEDGVNGMEELHRSAAFLRRKMERHFSSCSR